MSEDKLITVHATWSQDWWALSVEEIPGLFTQVRKLTDAEPALRDAADLLGVTEPFTISHLDIATTDRDAIIADLAGKHATPPHHPREDRPE